MSSYTCQFSTARFEAEIKVGMTSTYCTEDKCTHI